MTDRLPPSVQEIADVIGREKALLLVGKLPASSARSWRRIVYIPKRLNCKSGHQLVCYVGWNAAEKLVRHFGGEILQPANCSKVFSSWKAEQIRRMAKAGTCFDAIAQVFQMSRSDVLQALREAYRNPPEDAKTLPCDGGSDLSATIEGCDQWNSLISR